MAKVLHSKGEVVEVVEVLRPEGEVVVALRPE